MRVFTLPGRPISVALALALISGGLALGQDAPKLPTYLSVRYDTDAEKTGIWLLDDKGKLLFKMSGASDDPFTMIDFKFAENFSEDSPNELKMTWNNVNLLSDLLGMPLGLRDVLSAFKSGDNTYDISYGLRQGFRDGGDNRDFYLQGGLEAQWVKDEAGEETSDGRIAAEIRLTLGFGGKPTALGALRRLGPSHVSADALRGAAAKVANSARTHLTAALAQTAGAEGAAMGAQRNRTSNPALNALLEPSTYGAVSPLLSLSVLAREGLGVRDFDATAFLESLAADTQVAKMAGLLEGHGLTASEQAAASAVLQAARMILLSEDGVALRKQDASKALLSTAMSGAVPTTVQSTAAWRALNALSALLAQDRLEARADFANNRVNSKFSLIRGIEDIAADRQEVEPPIKFYLQGFGWQPFGERAKGNLSACLQYKFRTGSKEDEVKPGLMISYSVSDLPTGESFGDSGRFYVGLVIPLKERIQPGAAPGLRAVRLSPANDRIRDSSRITKR